MHALIDIEHAEASRFDDIASALRKAAADPRAFRHISAKPSGTAEGALYKLMDNYKPYSGKGEGAGEPLALKLKDEPPIQKHLGRVDDWIVAEAAKSGVNIEGYSHEITDDFIRHVKKEHGDAQHEAARGNVAITDEDFAQLKDVIENPDFVAVGIKNKRNQNIIAYAKELDDGTALYFEEVLSASKKKLSGKTFYKKKKRLSSGKFSHILTVNKKNNFENMRVIQRVVAKSTLALPVNGTRCRQPSPTTKGIPSKESIPQSAKNASEIPRFMVKKSVARQILHTPLPRLALTKSGRLVVRK